MSEVDSEFVKKCIRAVGKIAIRYEKSVEKCMGIISKQVKEIRTAAQHAETIVDELLIVIIPFILDRSKYPQKVSIQVQLWWNVWRSCRIVLIRHWTSLKVSSRLDPRWVCRVNLRSVDDQLQEMDCQLWNIRKNRPTLNPQLCC